jgi:Na+-transporting methylmalonyl-CoA/oxaloacetate decarboxylase beta subunit
MDGQAGGSPMKRLGKFARIGAIVFAALGILTLLADRLFQRWLLHKALATAAPELIHSGEAASIGIIGGADGPTAIFITSHTVVDAAGGHRRVVCGPRGSLSGGLAPAPQTE